MADMERWGNESRSDRRAQGMACCRRSEANDTEICSMILFIKCNTTLPKY